MEEKNITILLTAFLALIVGISLIGVIATTSNEITGTVNISGETIDYSSARESETGAVDTTEFTIANPPTTWRITECPITGLVLYNDSGSLTNVVDYSFTASTGIIVFNNTANVNGSESNVTTATYQYCDSEYLTQGWNRSVLKMVPGFFALALLGVSIGLFYAVGRREGIW